VRARRVPVVDEYTEDGEAAVFVDGRVVVLSPLATHLLGLVDDDEWTDLRTLSQGLEAAFGVPPTGSAAEATAEALQALEAEGVVEIENSVNRPISN
jgi:hypothetical protein